MPNRPRQEAAVKKMADLPTPELVRLRASIGLEA